MNYNVLLLLLFGHLLADFPFQISYIVNMRRHDNRRKRLKGNSIHAGIHLITYLLLLFLFNYITIQSLGFVVLLSFTHLLVDLFKSRLVIEYKLEKYNVLIFICDQLFHYFLIIVIAYFISVRSFSFRSIFEIQKQALIFMSTITFNQSLLLACCLLAAGLWGTGIFIKIFIEYLEFAPYEKIVNIGKSNIENTAVKKYNADVSYIIGILERLFIICAIVFKIPSGIALAIGLKSIARFKEFDDDWFVKIFIIGSFISIISAIVVGIIIRELNIFPGLTVS